MSERKSRIRAVELEPLTIQPRLKIGLAELPPQASRLVTMLCDDPTDADLIEIDWYIDAACRRH